MCHAVVFGGNVTLADPLLLFSRVMLPRAHVSSLFLRIHISFVPIPVSEVQSEVDVCAAGLPTAGCSL